MLETAVASISFVDECSRIAEINAIFLSGGIMRQMLRRGVSCIGVSVGLVALVFAGCQHFQSDDRTADDLVPQVDETEEAEGDDRRARAGKPEIIIEDDFDTLVERAEETGEEIRHHKWAFDAVSCREWIAWDVDIRECAMEMEPHREAMILSMAYDCTGDICEYARWAVTAPQVYIRLIWADDSPTTVTPSVDSYFVGFLDGSPGLADASAGTVTDAAPEQSEEEGDGEEEADEADAVAVEPTLYRVGHTTGEVDEVADCLSPQIAPDGQWVLCRDLDGRVLRVSVDGGEPEVVDEPDVGERSVYVRPEEGIVPGKPWFVDDETLRYDIVTESEPGADDPERETVTVEWEN